MRGFKVTVCWGVLTIALVAADADAEVLANLPQPSQSQPAEPTLSERGMPGTYQSDWQEFDTDRLVRRSLVATCGLATACIIALWSSRRVRAHRSRSASNKRDSMAVLETLCLAPRCSLQLVRVDSQKFLVARDTSGVRSITPVTSFADTLSDESDNVDNSSLPEHISKLGSFTQFDRVGISLEQDQANPFPHITTRRRDPWQGPSLNR